MVALLGDAYTLAHLLLMTGALYLAAGVEEVISHVTAGGSEHADAALGWLAAIALYGGVALYLVGRVAFVRLTDGPVAVAPLVAAGLVLLLLPAAASLPAMAALGLLFVLMVAVTGYDRLGAVAPA